MASGILSGKYNDGNLPEGSRFTENPELMRIYDMYLGGDKKEAGLKKLRGLEALAKELGTDQVSLCLAWAISNRDVSTCLLGFSRPEQVE